MGAGETILQCMYIFDPSCGLFEFTGKDLPDKINDFFQKEYEAIIKYHFACYHRKKSQNSSESFTPADFRNFHVMILPCFQSSAIFNSPDPKKGVGAWTVNPRSLQDYLYHLVFEEAVDIIKSWV